MGSGGMEEFLGDMGAEETDGPAILGEMGSEFPVPQRGNRLDLPLHSQERRLSVHESSECPEKTRLESNSAGRIISIEASNSSSRQRKPDPVREG